MGVRARLGAVISGWLNAEQTALGSPLCDYEKLSYELRVADVLLIEGRSRVSDVIRTITQSTWTHSALYIGRLHDIQDPDMRETVRQFYEGNPEEQLVVEAMLGKGTIVTPLSHYQHEHMRLCRARGLSPGDAQKVIGHAIDTLGTSYDMRQLLDLARFMFPYTILPRRWRSSLFQHNAGKPTSTVCSTMIATAFMQVRFPILPVTLKNKDGSFSLYQRNPKLFTPSDFDYSPYFDIIKYPIWNLQKGTHYESMPWNEEGAFFNAPGDFYVPRTADTDNDNDDSIINNPITDLHPIKE